MPKKQTLTTILVYSNLSYFNELIQLEYLTLRDSTHLFSLFEKKNTLIKVPECQNLPLKINSRPIFF